MVQAKDTMRLMGVTRACPVLASSVSAGGSATSWVVEEFSAQIRLVCKIALNRQKNLATFLEQNGKCCCPTVMFPLSELFAYCSVSQMLCANMFNYYSVRRTICGGWIDSSVLGDPCERAA